MGRAFEVRKASMMKTGLAKGKIYSRHSKEIYICAKNGGTDPEANLSLKRLIEKAKKDQVPADVIKRAIDKVSSGAGEDYKENRYEGFGPNGSTILVDCLTDNANRTISEVKNCFTKTDNKIGVSGAVSHMYSHVGIIDLSNTDEDTVMETLLMADLDVKDIEEEDGIISVYTEPSDFLAVRNELANAIGEDNIETDEITWVSSIEVELSGDDQASFEKLLSMLNECDDVQNIYHNVSNM